MTYIRVIKIDIKGCLRNLKGLKGLIWEYLYLFLTDCAIVGLLDAWNREMKELFFENVDVDLFARFVVHYCFRNGPLEDMHAQGKLSLEDMKTLNKFLWVKAV